jgi:hypothetical protein
MLFDLRGRGRRRTVRVLYTFLALLIGVGLVGFGVGGGFGGGGILSAANSNEGSGSSSFLAQIKKYQKLTQREPRNPAAWEGLVKARLQESSNFTQNGVTSKGKELFQQASEAWQSYLALNPATPSTLLAQEMVPIYSEEGLNQPAQAVAALQIVVAARPTSAALYAQLAQYAYKAHNQRTGDLAALKAVALAPSTQRARVKTELETIRLDPNNERTFTTTTNGKTYAVKKAGSSTSFTGTEITKTPQPAGSVPTLTLPAKK